MDAGTSRAQSLGVRARRGPVWEYLLLIPTIILLCRSAAARRRTRRFLRQTGPAWQRCYSRRSFLRLGVGILAAGALAYSGADGAVESWHARVVRGRGSNALATLVKVWGERVWFAVWALLAALDATLRSSALSRWGRESFEATLVGLPLLWTTQRALGGARPGAEARGSRWRLLADDKSASGHAFMAAIPWLTLARRLGGSLERFLARGASLLGGWSRLNDRMHYPSQILLGYLIAWSAVDAAGKAREGRDTAAGIQKAGTVADGNPQAATLPPER
jgi:membrane-associated phospholipid phosphatase